MLTNILIVLKIRLKAQFASLTLYSPVRQREDITKNSLEIDVRGVFLNAKVSERPEKYYDCCSDNWVVVQ